MNDIKQKIQDFKLDEKQGTSQAFILSRYLLYQWPKVIKISKKYQKILPLIFRKRKNQYCELKTNVGPVSGSQGFIDNFPGRRLGQDMVETIRSKVFESQTVKLSEMLHQVGSTKIEYRQAINWNEEIAINLHNNIIQTVNYMYKHKMTTQHAINLFYKETSSIEISAISMIINHITAHHYLDISYISQFANIKTIPRYDFSHYMTVFEALKGKQLSIVELKSNQEMIHRFFQMKT
ncbi:hypothetical protein PGTUg99_033480 [Puccinia graminis f. sp. tritici]|uniref:Uncharacterized protein n=1 Tax=Puccinia graminis f. sp. tritici TaxID=56615 RepID=A0A5B0S0W3_PUCGR|nr:hypothetical protein PGTUg99_033480 [Puccinia graminis f. sp. tritici]